jgi:hypothetical protein
MKTLADRSRKNTVEARQADLPNIHPADELAAVREEIKILEKQESALRDKLLACTSPLELMGDQHNAVIIANTRETLDRKAIEEAFGAAAVAPFLKVTNYKTVKLLEK